MKSLRKFSFLIVVFALSLSVAIAKEGDKKNDKTAEKGIQFTEGSWAAILKKAKQEKKHVFIQVGGNWCVWCIRFHDLVNATPDLKNYLNSNYETVLVNWSPENKNEAVLKKLGYPGRFGFPVFLILDGDGKLIHTQNSAYLEEGGGHSVKKVTDFLKNWNYGALLPENNKN